MKWSMASVGVIVLGIIGVMVIVLFQQLTTSSENDYYLLKEITEAAMIESIDLKYYRETGNLKIVKEKFVENFTRRYNESTLFIGTKYTIKFFDIIETPPKATVTIDTGLDKYRIYDTVNDYTVYNNLTGILEYIGKGTEKTSDPFVTNKTYSQTIYFVYDSSSLARPLNIPKEINTVNIKNQKIIKISSETMTDDEIELAKLRNEIDWANTTQDYFKTTYTKGSATAGYYNCYNDSSYNYGNRPTECSTYKNNISGKNLPWIKINSSTKDKIYKYKVTWKYDEYEYK